MNNTAPEAKHTPEYKCATCGDHINEGEFKTFGVCDNCWDDHYRNTGKLHETISKAPSLSQEVAELRKENERLKGSENRYKSMIALLNVDTQEELTEMEFALLAKMDAQAETIKRLTEENEKQDKALDIRSNWIARLTEALEKCRGLLERYHDSGMQDHRQTEMLIEIKSALLGTKETE